MIGPKTVCAMPLPVRVGTFGVLVLIIVFASGCKPKTQQSFVYDESTTHTANVRGSRGVVQLKLPQAAGRILSVKEFRITSDNNASLNPVPRAGRFAQLTFTGGEIKLVVETSNGNKCEVVSKGGIRSGVSASCGGSLIATSPSPTISSSPAPSPSGSPDSSPSPGPSPSSSPSPSANGQTTTPTPTNTPLTGVDSILRSDGNDDQSPPAGLKIISQSSPEPLLNETNRAILANLRESCADNQGIDPKSTDDTDTTYTCICTRRPDGSQIVSYWDYLEKTEEEFATFCSYEETPSPSPSAESSEPRSVD